MYTFTWKNLLGFSEKFAGKLILRYTGLLVQPLYGQTCLLGQTLLGRRGVFGQTLLRRKLLLGQTLLGQTNWASIT